MPLAGLAAAGIAALGGLFSNKQNAEYNAEEAQKNREFQEHMYERQYKDSIDFWKLQQDYNTPANQLMRLTSAGMNPLLAYGQSGLSGNIAGSQPNLPSAPSGAQGRASFVNPLQTAQYLLIDAQRRVLDSQAIKNEKEAENIASQTEGQNIQNYIEDKTKDLQIAMRHNNNDLILANIREIDNNVFQSIQLTTQQVLTLMQARQYEIKRFNLSEEQVVANIEQGWANIENGRIQADAAWQNAAAAWKNAVTLADLSAAQKYNLYQAGREMAMNAEFLEKSMDDRLRNVKLGNTNLGMNTFNSYMDMLLKRAQIPYWKAQTIKTTMEGNYLRGRNIRETGQTLMNGLNFNFNMAVKALTLMPQNP